MVYILYTTNAPLLAHFQPTQPHLDIFQYPLLNIFQQLLFLFLEKTKKKVK